MDGDRDGRRGRDREQTTAAAAATVQHFGRIDVPCNIAVVPKLIEASGGKIVNVGTFAA